MAITKRNWWLLAASLAIIGLAGYFALYPNRIRDNGSGELTRYERMPAFKPTDRITVVSPHLDDETIGLGGMIAQARQQGVPVSVVFMTNGDDFPLGAELQFGTGYATPEQLIESGKTRQQEALSALSKLGVAKESITFLGLPDRGLLDLHSAKYLSSPYRAPGTLRTSSPYDLTFVKDLPYTGTAVRTALASAVNATNPTYVFTTLPEDRHADHSATAMFLKDILPEVASKPRPYYFLVHYKGYPSPKGVSQSLFLVPPKNLAGKPWKVVMLEADDIRKKQDAVNEYKSQTRVPFSGGLLRQFVRQNELVTQ